MLWFKIRYHVACDGGISNMEHSCHRRRGMDDSCWTFAFWSMWPGAAISVVITKDIKNRQINQDMIKCDTAMSTVFDYCSNLPITISCQDETRKSVVICHSFKFILQVPVLLVANCPSLMNNVDITCCSRMTCLETFVCLNLQATKVFFLSLCFWLRQCLEWP